MSDILSFNGDLILANTLNIILLLKSSYIVLFLTGSINCSGSLKYFGVYIVNPIYSLSSYLM